MLRSNVTINSTQIINVSYVYSTHGLFIIVIIHKNTTKHIFTCTLHCAISIEAQAVRSAGLEIGGCPLVRDN